MQTNNKRIKTMLIKNNDGRVLMSCQVYKRRNSG